MHHFNMNLNIHVWMPKYPPPGFLRPRPRHRQEIDFMLSPPSLLCFSSSSRESGERSLLISPILDSFHFILSQFSRSVTEAHQFFYSFRFRKLVIFHLAFSPFLRCWVNALWRGWEMSRMKFIPARDFNQTKALTSDSGWFLLNVLKRTLRWWDVC